MKVITESQVKLTEGDYARMLAKGAKNIEAYLKCLRAIPIFRSLNKENNLKSRKMFGEAIALDPNYPRPYIYLGWTHLADAGFGWSKSREQSLALAEKLARKALELDDSLGLPHRLLSDIYRHRKQWDKGLTEAELAVSIDPNTMTIYGLATFLGCVGRNEESIAWWEKAFRLDPIPPPLYLDWSGSAYFKAERYEDALTQFKRVIEHAKKGEYNLKLAHLSLAMTYAMLGQVEKAGSHVKEVLRVDPKSSVSRQAKYYHIIYKNQADADHMINALRKAGLPEKPPLPLPDKPSIAVLPLKNISDDPKQEYFVDGMSDTLITDLSKISGLFVIASTSMFTYKGKTVKVEQIGRDLGVRYVLEGSVQRADNQLRINAQLVDARTGGHLWAERYDGKMDNIFGLQDKITQKIVSALAVKLTADEQEQVAGKYTDNIAAYDNFLKGMGHATRYTHDDTLQAIRYLKRAIELDPNYGPAYARLGLIYWNSPPPWTDLTWPLQMFFARDCLQAAMKNPDHHAHRLAAEINLRLRLHEKAISEAERAFTLAPNDPSTHHIMSRVLIYAGRPKEAVKFAELEMRQNPRQIYSALCWLGMTHFSMGNLEQATTCFERSLSHNPEFLPNYTFLAATYAHLGREKEAREALDNYSRFHRGWKPTLRGIMYFDPFKNPKVAERYADGLLKAGIKGTPSGYYKIPEENRLTGEEIRKLVMGREIRTLCINVGLDYVNRTKDGTVNHARYGSGKSRILDDLLCDKWDSRYDGLEYCGTVFRNPEGAPDTNDEYIYLTDFQFCSLSPVEGSPSGSSKILTENRLSGEEIKILMFGHTITGFNPGIEVQWWGKQNKDGGIIEYWTDDGFSDSVKGWLEGDLTCAQWKIIGGGIKDCNHVYRNPDGTPENKDEYLMVGKDTIRPFSPID